MRGLGENKRSLSEEEKNELVLKYKGIVHYYANRYRFFDPEIDEVKAWGYLGLAKVIHRYENESDIEIEAIVFSTIRKEILGQYTKNRRPKSEGSLQQVMFAGDSSDLTLESLIADDSITISKFDIRMLIEDALIMESEQFKRIIMDYLFTTKDDEQIIEENNVSQIVASRTRRRGRALIKQYLVNNGIILDHLITPDHEKGKMISNHEGILSSEFGKIKYIKKYYSFLNENDIATLVNASPYMVSNLLDYPSAKYLQTGTDDSVEEKVIHYCQRKYPGRLPSGVITIPFDEFQKTV